LHNPDIARTQVVVPAAQWWRDIRVRHQSSRVIFVGDDDLIGK
jgi:hypothetical protein